MVRTTGGIRISAGKSSKKSGSGGGSSHSTPSTPSGKSTSKGSTRLPPIPICEAPSWQKPITNFFNPDPGSSKHINTKVVENEAKAGSSNETIESSDQSINTEVTEKIEDKNEKSGIKRDKNDSSSDEEVPEKRRKEEEKGKENVDGNVSSCVL